MNDKGSKFYYSRLDEGEKQLYDKISEAWLAFEPVLAIHISKGKSFFADTSKVLNAVLFDNPVFFFVNRDNIIIKQTPMYLQFNFQYTYGKEEAEHLWAQVETKIDTFMKLNIKPGMSPLAKQIHAHRFVSCTLYAAKPPYEDDCFSVVGALVKNRCVCEGFAKAYKLLCDRLGIASIIVLGDAVRPDGTKEAHAWNISRISGVTAHVDTCWDSQFGISSYDYFNLSDADISADHSFDTTLYPKCEPNKINYFYKNNLIAHDEQELIRMVEEKADLHYFSIKLLFPFSAERAWKLPFDIGEIRYNPVQNIISYSKAVME